MDGTRARRSVCSAGSSFSPDRPDDRARPIGPLIRADPNGRGQRLDPNTDRAIRAAWATELYRSDPILEQPGRITAIVLDPGGQTALTRGERDRDARLWDVATGQPIGKLLVNDPDFRCAAFSPDGRTVLIGTNAGVAQLCEVATGRAVAGPWDHGTAVAAVAFQPDGKRGLTGDLGGFVRLWDTETGQPVEETPRAPMGPGARRRSGRANPSSRWVLKAERPVSAVAISPDGRTILTGHAGNVARLWDAEARRLRWELKRTEAIPPNRSGIPDWITVVAFSPDGQRVAIGGDAGTAQLWDVADRGGFQPIGKPMEHRGAITGVAFRPDGRALVTGSRDGTARLWDAATGLPIGEPMEQQSAVLALTFRADSPRAVIACGDAIVGARGRPAPANTWKISQSNAVARRPFESVLTIRDGVLHAAFDPDGRTLRIVRPDGTVQSWDPTTGRRTGELKLDTGGLPIAKAASSPDGKLLLGGQGRDVARLWELATGRLIAGPLQPESRNTLTRMDAILIGPGGRVTRTTSPIAVWWHGPAEWIIYSLARPSSSVAKWDVTFRTIGEIPVRLPFERSGVFYALGDFSPDGKVVMAGDRLWETATGRPIGEAWDLPPGRGVSVFSPDSRVVLTSRFDDLTGRGRIQFWDAATGRSLGGPLEQHEPIFHVAFSPDHRLLLIPTIAGTRQTIVLWDFATRRRIGRTMNCEEMGFPNAAIGRAMVAFTFSPDGSRILVRGDFRGTGIGTSAQLWKAPALLGGDVEQVDLYTQDLSGMELDRRGDPRALSPEEREDCRRRLAQRGAPPLREPGRLGEAAPAPDAASSADHH
jgi:WD40 repeat protein